MADIPDIYHRRSIRLKGYDYTQPGAYFVTICIQDRDYLLGAIRGAQMILNEAGAMLARWWTELPHKFPAVEIDEYMVMPNHFHGVVVIVDPNPAGADHVVADHAGAAHVGADLRVRPGAGTHTGAGTHVGVPLPTVMQWFKTMTTNEYIWGVKQYGWAPFRGKLWQRNYYEHIIRDQNDLDRVRRYIRHNPLNWQKDREFNA